jgi:hypothetical protein
MSSVTLTRASPSDFTRLFTILSTSFGHIHPFIEALYPLHETESGRVTGGSRLLATAQTDPYTTFVKAVTEDGSIAGFAKWNVYDGVVPKAAKLEGEFWGGDVEAKEIAVHLSDSYFVLRRKALEAVGGRLCCEFWLFFWSCPLYTSLWI